MNLTKKEIEAVRYQFRKADEMVTNVEITNAAMVFTDFDAVEIAKVIRTTREVGDILLKENSSTETSALTLASRTALTEIQVREMGIQLSPAEIQQIAEMVDPQVNDILDFLNQVKDVIEHLLAERNEKIHRKVNQCIDDIADVVNTSNDRAADIFKSADSRIHSLVEQCRVNPTDYKSTTASRISSIKKALGLSK